MTPEFVITLGRDAMRMAFLLSAPPLVAALVVGLIISVFQAVTQIQEMTLTIVPKMVAVLAVLIVTFPWLLDLLTSYTSRIFQMIPTVAH